VAVQLRYRYHTRLPAGTPNPIGEERNMKDTLLKISIKIQTLLMNEEGQDLIEYGLLVALVGFAATAGMKTLANDINTLFTNIGGTLTSIG
jgi:pilus assembly protein Flp/PilA